MEEEFDIGEIRGELEKEVEQEAFRPSSCKRTRTDGVKEIITIPTKEEMQKEQSRERAEAFLIRLKLLRSQLKNE